MFWSTRDHTSSRFAAAKLDPAAGLPRLRFSPPATTAAFALAGGIAVWAAYPEAGLNERLAAADGNDPVTRTYVHAWLERHPDDEAVHFAAVRIALRSYTDAGTSDALARLTMLAQSRNPRVRAEAEWQRLDLTERNAYGFEPSTEAYTRALEQLTGELRRLASNNWPLDRLRSLAKRANNAGDWALAHQLYMRVADRVPSEEIIAEAARTAEAARDPVTALALYQRLAEGGGEESSRWLESAARVAIASERAAEAIKMYLTLAERSPGNASARLAEAARLALGAGQYAESAELSLRAMATTTVREERRTQFLAAVRTLQAGNHLDRALAVAERHATEFLGEVETVEILARLALAANRPAQAERYVRLMLQLSRGPGERLWSRLVALAGNVIGVAHAATDPTRAPLRITLPFDDARYRLAFEIFAGNRNLQDARRVAEAAVARMPQDMEWRKRLAQVSEWDGEPRSALVHWLVHARGTDSEESWDAVLRIAPALFDHDSHILALEAKLKKNSSDKLLLELVRVYEEAGRAREGVALLAQRTKSTDSIDLLNALAELATRVGDDRTALGAYDRMIERHGLTPRIALKQSVLLFTLGRPQEAWRLMAGAREEAAPQDREFWAAYSQFAQFLSEHNEAARGLRRLIDLPKPDPADFARLVALVRATDTREAARLAEHAYAKLRTPDWAEMALEIHATERDWTSFGRLLGKLWAKDLAVLERDVGFLSARARYHEATGDPARGRADLLAAADISPRDMSFRQTVLWQLIGAKARDELGELIERWRDDAEKEPSLWQVYAAGYVALGQPERAISYYDRAVRQRNTDTLLMLAYAATLERVKNVDKAWSIRKHVWTKLRQPETIAKARAQTEEGREVHRAFVELALKFAPPDTSAILLGELLRRESQTSLSPAAKELALTWAMDAGATGAARAWLLQQYAGDLARNTPRPYWAEISIALAGDDRATLVRLLDDQPDLLPSYDRVEATQRVGRRKEAEQLALDLLDRNQADDDMHARVVATTLPNHDWIGASLRHLKLGPLSITETTARGTYKVSESLHLGAGAVRRDSATNDPIRLPSIPGRDQAVELFAQKLMDADDVTAALTHRAAAAAHTGARVEWRARFDRGDTRVTAGARQPAIESTPLRVAGMKDYVEATASHRLSKREYVSGTVRADRFASQAGTQLGRGAVATIEAGHLMRTEQPDLSVRMAATRAVYRAGGAVDSVIAAVLPAGSEPTAAQAVPRSFTQVGAFVGSGDANREEYTRALRPLADAGLTWSNTAGGGYNVRVGVAGSVAGTDHLAIYVAQSKGARGTKDILREIGMAYRW